MSDSPQHKLTTCLNAIEAIARDLRAVEKRAELKIKAQELFVLVEAARQAGIALHQQGCEPPGVRFARYKGMR
ncbi:hypothetical protein SAMN05216428_101106 [Nitrosospira sp. Nsp11]|uniref:hypothetical protein n=1 Tax=Nitrosospira sp. Nsp11 TaxID=1855338 RepID=UPI000915E0A7|nr:hypothetical protein [Nitrosospira sp. Nsp11]SHL11062.1 hypothetical protein SAMN05216428_101106 [Nitrosospira sp. Nsp11]